MSKKTFMALFFVLIFVPFAFAETSGDNEIYLRRDVFEAKMDAFMAEIRLGNEQLRREMQEMEARLDNKIQGVKSELHEEIQGVNAGLHGEVQSLKSELKADIHALEIQTAKLEARVSNVETRVGNVETMVQWILAILGIFAASLALVPSLLPWLKNIFGRMKYMASASRPDVDLDKLRDLIRLEVERALAVSK